MNQHKRKFEIFSFRANLSVSLSTVKVILFQCLSNKKPQQKENHTKPTDQNHKKNPNTNSPHTPKKTPINKKQKPTKNPTKKTQAVDLFGTLKLCNFLQK